MQGTQRYPCEFSEDTVTSRRQRFRAINISVSNVHNVHGNNSFRGFATSRASWALE